MLISDIVKQAAYGDLKTLAIADCFSVDEKTRALTAEALANQETIVNFINQGLIELHKRFTLKVNTKDVEIDPDDMTVPVVLPENAFYLLKVVYTEKPDIVIPVDDSRIEDRFTQKDYKGLFIKTVAANTFLIKGDDGNTDEHLLTFHYTASPDPLKYNGKLTLPYAYHEALLNYVSYRAYSSTTSVTPAGDIGLSYKKRFEDSCLHLREVTDSLYEPFYDDRWNARGFV